MYFFKKRVSKLNILWPLLQLLFYLKKKVADIYQLSGAKPSGKNIRLFCFCLFPTSNHCSSR